MSVSKTRWAKKAGPEIKKGNVENKIHMQFNVQHYLKNKKLVSPLKACNSGQAIKSSISHAEESTLQQCRPHCKYTSNQLKTQNYHSEMT